MYGCDIVSCCFLLSFYCFPKNHQPVYRSLNACFMLCFAVYGQIKSPFLVMQKKRPCARKYQAVRKCSKGSKMRLDMRPCKINAPPSYSSDESSADSKEQKQKQAISSLSYPVSSCCFFVFFVCLLPFFFNLPSLSRWPFRWFSRWLSRWPCRLAGRWRRRCCLCG